MSILPGCLCTLPPECLPTANRTGSISRRCGSVVLPNNFDRHPDGFGRRFLVLATWGLYQAGLPNQQSRLARVYPYRKEQVDVISRCMLCYARCRSSDLYVSSKRILPVCVYCTLSKAKRINKQKKPCLRRVDFVFLSSALLASQPCESCALQVARIPLVTFIDEDYSRGPRTLISRPCKQ